MDEKLKIIADIAGVDENKVALVLYAYLSECIQELLVYKTSRTMFGRMNLDDNNEIVLTKSKYGFIDLLDKTNKETIKRIVRYGPDRNPFATP